MRTSPDRLVFLTILAVVGSAAPAWAVTYQVGPGRANRQIAALAPTLLPGDIVEVDGDAVYEPFVLEANGTSAQPITLRGLPVNGNRPVIEGGVLEGAYTIIVEGDWTTIEGFEVRGGTQVCVFNKAHGVILRDSVVHDCYRHGILGADDESGSFTMSYVEVYGAGREIEGESLKHPVYLATDETLNPGSVFRLEHSWIHDNNGGNSVKTRSERNELYYNWIEGSHYYVIELIGPETETGLGPPREDSDVVGNVLVHTSSTYVTRVGSDETGATEGRHRFSNNTFLVGPGAGGVVRVHQQAETVEFYNNVFVRQGANWDGFMRDSDAVWVGGRNVKGANNWFSNNGEITDLPAEFTGNLFGPDPMFNDLVNFDLRPAEGSPLIDAGTQATTTADGSPPRALGMPGFVPPLFVREPAGGAFSRNAVGVVDLGAYEFGSPTGEPGDHTPGSGPGGGGGGAVDGGGGGGGEGPSVSGLVGGCAIAHGRTTGGGGGMLGLLGLLGLVLRRRPTRPRARSSARAG